ncbi:MAG: ABC transporter substrate-binding protein [Comamonas sp.]|nr:ABC transporter substrate-binding protein [Candidatus Comamonas equi]
MQSWHRRDFLNRSACAMAALPLLAHANTERVRIAELKMVPHAALDADERGFVAGLAKGGFTQGQNLHIERFDAQGNTQQLKQMAQHISQSKFDLIHTISTLPTQHILAHVKYTPVVFSSVTDPQFAEIIPQQLFQDAPHRSNMTGVSDQWPVDLQFHVYASLVPHAKVWGTLYNPAEANSVIHLQRMQATAHARGVQLLEAQVHHPDQVKQAALSLVPRVQAVTITSDNTSSARIEDLATVCNAYQRPLFAGDIDSVERGAVAAYGLNYFLVGYAAGRKAALILQGVSAGDLPWTRIDKFSLALNLKAAQLQGVELSASVQARAHRILR